MILKERVDAQVTDIRGSICISIAVGIIVQILLNLFLSHCWLTPAMEQPSIGSNNSHFRGGVQGHTGQLTPAQFLTV
jgi:hypothetical protein